MASVTKFESFWHRQQAVLHQLVGHVLALRPCQEAPDWIRFAPGLHHVCTFIALGLLTVLPRFQADRIHLLIRFLTSRVFGRPSQGWGLGLAAQNVFAHSGLLSLLLVYMPSGKLLCKLRVNFNFYRPCKPCSNLE